MKNTRTAVLEYIYSAEIGDLERTWAERQVPKVRYEARRNASAMKNGKIRRVAERPGGSCWQMVSRDIF